MARKRYKPEEIVSMLRQAEVLHGQGMSMADAIRQLGISEVTYYRWRKEYGGMSGDQLRRLSGAREGERAAAPGGLGSDAGQADFTEAARGNIFSSLFGALGSMLLSAPLDPVQRPRGSRFSPRST